MHFKIERGIATNHSADILSYFSDTDTYIRKSAYIATGRIFLAEKEQKDKVLTILNELFLRPEHAIRQTVINAAGEIGKIDFECIKHLMERGIFDAHHTVKNAVIGSIKKMAEVNPKPVLAWSKQYLQHPDKEIRREICHGIELRGRKHPQDILPMLKTLQNDPTARVRNTLVHVLGQIAYKKGCLETVITSLNDWSNADLVEKAIAEIIDVHDRYRNFSHYTQEEAKKIISRMRGGHSGT